MFQKSTVRKYSCFICGREYENQEQFQQHIVDSHEEGREYLICPLPHCNAVVRDMKSHFKVKHMGNKVPPNCQERAIIWKDVNPNSKKNKTRKPTFRKGTYVSIKNNGKEMTYRSGFECEVYEVLEQLDEITAYDVEPFKEGIPYLFEGSMHKYFPDLSVKFYDDKVEIWEVKPANQTSLPINEAKWSAAKDFCEKRGWQFVVITEVGLQKLRQLAKNN